MTDVAYMRSQSCASATHIDIFSDIYGYTEASLWTILSKCQLRGYALFIIFRGYAHNKHYDDLGITFILVTYMYYTLSQHLFYAATLAVLESRKTTCAYIKRLS